MELLGLPEDNYTPWDPWVTVELMGNIRVELTGLLPAGVDGACVVEGDQAAIMLARGLHPYTRRWVLAHELCHVERDGGCAPMPWNRLWDPMVRREEHRVDKVACGRLVPWGSLSALIGQAVDVEGRPCEHELADHYQVPEPAVRLAMAGLKIGPGLGVGS